MSSAENTDGISDETRAAFDLIARTVEEETWDLALATVLRDLTFLHEITPLHPHVFLVVESLRKTDETTRKARINEIADLYLRRRAK